MGSIRRRRRTTTPAPHGLGRPLSRRLGRLFASLGSQKVDKGSNRNKALLADFYRLKRKVAHQQLVPGGLVGDPSEFARLRERDVVDAGEGGIDLGSNESSNIGGHGDLLRGRSTCQHIASLDCPWFLPRDPQ